MNDIIAVDRTIAVDDLFQDRKSFDLRQTFFGFNSFAKVLVTELSYDACIDFSVIDIVELDDVLLVP